MCIINSAASTRQNSSLSEKTFRPPEKSTCSEIEFELASSSAPSRGVEPSDSPFSPALSTRLCPTQDADHNVTATPYVSQTTLSRCALRFHGSSSIENACGSVQDDLLAVGDTNLFGTAYACDQDQGQGPDFETLTFHSRNRAYLTGLGRFAQEDPSQYVNGANTIQFAESNPISAVDPTGTATTQPTATQPTTQPSVQPGILQWPEFLQPDNSSGDGPGFEFRWGPTGLDPSKHYAQVNVTDISGTALDGSPISGSTVVIDPITLIDQDGYGINPPGEGTIPVAKGSYADKQEFHNNGNVKQIVEHSYVYIVEIQNPAKVPPLANGYKSLGCAGGKNISATQAPDGADVPISNETATYVKTVFQYEWTLVYDGQHNSGAAYWHGADWIGGPFGSKGGNPSKYPDPDPNIQPKPIPFK